MMYPKAIVFLFPKPVSELLNPLGRELTDNLSRSRNGSGARHSSMAPETQWSISFFHNDHTVNMVCFDNEWAYGMGKLLKKADA